MKYFTHPLEVPRKLYLRPQKPVNDSTKAWDSFKGKKAVQDSLNSMQKHLCAYCEIELLKGDNEIGYHIEHIEPKSMNSSRTFDFSNLLLSCFTLGDEIPSTPDDPQPISCGHAKNSNFDPLLFIKPTDQGCEDYFFYELDGRISPNPDLIDLNKLDQVRYTITLLNLNCRRLKRKRRDMIEEGLISVNELLNDQSALSGFAEYELAEFNGKHRSFLTTRRQYFQDFIL